MSNKVKLVTRVREAVKKFHRAVKKDHWDSNSLKEEVYFYNTSFHFLSLIDAEQSALRTLERGD